MHTISEFILEWQYMYYVEFTKKVKKKKCSIVYNKGTAGMIWS